MKHQLAALMAAAFLVSGCSDPKAASESNFRQAIQSYLDTAYPKCYFTHAFPSSLKFDVGDTRAVLQAMAKAGLVTEKEESRKELTDWNGAKKVIVNSSFDLTDEGRKFYKADAVKSLSGNSVGGFCFGKAKVESITQFTEPADAFGHRVSRVNYTYTVTDIPEWAKTPDMLAALQPLKKDADSAAKPAEARDTLVLTSNGWLHEKLYKKQ